MPEWSERIRHFRFHGGFESGRVGECSGLAFRGGDDGEEGKSGEV